MTNTNENAVLTAAAPAKKRPPVIALILGLSAVMGLMLLAFAAPALHSGAKDLPLAVSGPAPAVAQVTSALEKQAPGAFDVHTYATSQAAASAIKNRDAIGGLALSPKGVTIQTASGAGAPYTNVLKGLGAQLSAKGQHVNYTNLAPLPKADPTGAAMTSAGLPLIFGGMATAALSFFAFRGQFRRRALTIAGVAVVGGMTAAAILHFWLDAIDGSYWKLAGAFVLGIAAISYTVIGFAKNLGAAGMGLGAVLMLFISNPLSGIATGPDWLPKPWGAIGQFLPVGASGHLLRSVAYFDGRGASQAIVVLTCWALGGLALLALGRRRNTGH